MGNDRCVEYENHLSGMHGGHFSRSYRGHIRQTKDDNISSLKKKNGYLRIEDFDSEKQFEVQISKSGKRHNLYNFENHKPEISENGLPRIGNITDWDFELEMEMLAYRLRDVIQLKPSAFTTFSSEVSEKSKSPAAGTVGPGGESKSLGGAGPRKQLPQVPDPETQLTLASKVNDRQASSPRSGNHSYGPFFLEYSLLAEFNQLQKQRLPGVYVIPSARSALYWHGVLFIRQGLYQEGVFKFSVQIPENYPDGDAPKLIFDPPVFHPVVHPETGELDVKRAFQKWRRNMNHIWHVLLYARRVFYKIDTRSPLNPEAAVLYEQDVELFKRKVQECVQSCKERVHDNPNTDDPHAFRFSPCENEVHEEHKKKMLQPSKKKKRDEEGLNAQTDGLSWMKKTSGQVFTADGNT